MNKSALFSNDRTQRYLLTRVWDDSLTIETVDDLCNQIADWIGVYGACKACNDSLEEANGCENENPLCCRTGFMMMLSERITQAVENDKKLDEMFNK